MTEILTQSWAWLELNSGALTAVIAIIGFVGVLHRYWSGRPQLVIAMAEGSKEESATLTVTNIGNRPAVDTRATWTRLSPMEMENFPQPKLIQSRESLRIELSLDHENRLRHNFRDGYEGKDSPFGFLRITWKRRVRRARTASAVVPLGAFGKGGLSTSVTLGKIPRTPFKQSNLYLWWYRSTGKEKQLEEASAYSQRIGEGLQLAIALKSLSEAGVIFPQVSDEEKAHLALGELGRRGWEWDFGPESFGYQVDAKKAYFPTIRASVTAQGRTLYEAAVIALHMAIESDRDHSGNVTQLS